MENGRIKEQRCRIEGYKSRDVEWKGKRVDMENGRIKYGDVE